MRLVCNILRNSAFCSSNIIRIAPLSASRSNRFDFSSNCTTMFFLLLSHFCPSTFQSYAGPDSLGSRRCCGWSLYSNNAMHGRLEKLGRDSNLPCNVIFIGPQQTLRAVWFDMRVLVYVQRKDGRKYASARLNSQREKGGEVGRRFGRFAVEISSWAFQASYQCY